MKNYQPIIIKKHNEQKRQFRAREHKTISNQQIVSMYEEALGRKPSEEQWDAAVKKDEVII